MRIPLPEPAAPANFMGIAYAMQQNLQERKRLLDEWEQRAIRAACEAGMIEKIEPQRTLRSRKEDIV